jgi:hypothetical protein
LPNLLHVIVRAREYIYGSHLHAVELSWRCAHWYWQRAVPVLPAWTPIPQAMDPGKVRGYLKRAFGDDLGDVEAAMGELAAAYGRDDIGGNAYRLYENFRHADGAEDAMPVLDWLQHMMPLRQLSLSDITMHCTVPCQPSRICVFLQGHSMHAQRRGLHVDRPTVSDGTRGWGAKADLVRGRRTRLQPLAPAACTCIAAACL